MTQHVNDTNASMAKANARTRGCNLWTRELWHIIWELAYSEYTAEKSLDAFRKARWRLWLDLDDDTRKVWNVKGEMAWDMVKGDLTKIIPPKLSLQ